MKSRWVITIVGFAIQISLTQAGFAGRIHAHSSVTPTERNIVDDISLFDGLVERREEHPHEFARFHPYLNRLLNHPDIAAHWTNDWLSDPGVYETQHHFDWIILERYFFMEEAMRRMENSLFTSDNWITIPPTYTGPILNSPAGDPPGYPAGESPAVPEPASLTLAMTGLLSLVALVATLRFVSGKAHRVVASVN